MLSVLAALALLLQAEASAPATATPRVVTSPDWIRRPTSEDMEHFYPDAAAKSGLSGRTVMSCGVTAEGTLTACRIDSELPRGQGFGEATLRMASIFRMTPKSADGKSVEGGTVRLPIRFVMAGGAEQQAKLMSAMNCYGHAAHIAEGAPLTPGAWQAAVFWSLEVGAATAGSGLRPSAYEDALAIGHREAREALERGLPTATRDRDTCLAKAKAGKP